MTKTTHPTSEPARTFWLGNGYMFQTFEELDSIIDKASEIKEIRQLLDENNADADKTDA